MYQQKKLKLAHFAIIRDTQILRIFQSLNCNNFGSNKGIVIKLSFFFFFEVRTTGLHTIFPVTIIGCGGEGLSRDHLCNVGPCPKVHFVTVTKSQVINFD